MRLVSFSLLGLASAARLQIQGPGSEIQFGTSSSPVALTASCDAEAATVTMLRPDTMSMTGDNQLPPIKVTLGNVAPSCEAVSDLRTPCASLPNSLPPPPLFWCKFIGELATSVQGPFIANVSALSLGSLHVGFNVSLDCPLPDYATITSLHPFVAGQTFHLNLSIVHYAPEGPLSHELRFAGRPGGHTLTFHELYAPPSPAPPRAPLVESAVYVRYGSNSCAAGSTLLYAGFVVGQQHNVLGGSIGGYCFHPDPQHPPDQVIGTQVARSSLYGTEYQTDVSYVTPESTRPAHDKDVACAACLVTDSWSTYVQWGRGQSCSNGHVTLYSGRVMGERDTHGRASTLCVDNALESHYASSAGDDNGTYERNWTALRELMHGPCAHATSHHHAIDGAARIRHMCRLPAVLGGDESWIDRRVGVSSGH